MHEYGLSSEEGVILMCIAEALLRIPDAETADALIAEKIAGGHWETPSRPFRQPVRQCLDLGADAHRPRRQAARGARRQPDRRLEAPRRALGRAGHPPGRAPGREAARRPVRARPHDPRGDRARQGYEEQGYRFSYDMLGEAARIAEGRRRYFERYMAAIEAVGQAAGPFSTMHPRCALHAPGPVGEAVGAASALRARQGRAPRRRARRRAC